MLIFQFYFRSFDREDNEVVVLPIEVFQFYFRSLGVLGMKILPKIQRLSILF